MDDLTLRLANLLDAALPHLERAARAERNRETGKFMRQVTAQKRLEAAKAAIAEAFARQKAGS